MAKHVAPTRLCFDVLEERTLLDGNVTGVLGSRGDLIIRGDKADNQFLIVQEAEVYRLTGLDGTTINGQSSVDISGVMRDVRISLSNGDDLVHVFGTEVPRDLVINGGRGTDLSA